MIPLPTQITLVKIWLILSNSLALMLTTKEQLSVHFSLSKAQNAGVKVSSILRLSNDLQVQLG